MEIEADGPTHPGRAQPEAVVVGAGPNGLSAAITLAREGIAVRVLEGAEAVGGGARSMALTLPGFVHDVCSAVYPFAVSSPAFRSFELERHALTWIQPPVPLAHVLDEGAVLLQRSVENTARELGQDAAVYRRVMEPFVVAWERLAEDALRPIGWPRHPWLFARFGLSALRSAAGFAAAHFQGNRARALFAGLAAHSFLPLEMAGGASFGLLLGAAAHAVGWPIAAGGSQRIAEALASRLHLAGGIITTGFTVRSLDELPPARAILCDVTPRQLMVLAGSRLTDGYHRALERFRYGPAAFKVDWALSGPIPWRDPDCARAGTLHLGGTLEEIAAAERQVAHDEHPERPFVLVCQPSRFDPSRAPAGRHTAWAYAHVPHGSSRDMAGAIEQQVERFAPGFRDLILARSTMSPMDLERHNPNLVGGDIAGGASDLRQLILRPTFRRYRTSTRGLYLCSASTPPGGGVHGMCGHGAARQALRDVFARGGGRPSA